MGKKLAIRGHSTRGHEVIELLKIMGGKICVDTNASDGYAYYIDRSNDMIICSNENAIKHNLDKYQLFTLEEFLEKYPFKVGDKVIDEAYGCPGVVCEMKWDEDVSDMKYCVAFGNGIDFGWFANDSIEFYKENENSKDIATNVEETQSKRDIDKAEFMIKHMILPNKVNDELEYKFPDGYEFDKVENGKIILKPIKPKYPKTYVECCEYIANSKSYAMNEHYTDVNKLLQTLQNLIICRNAYWKIAGEQMGLGKPWEPNWLDEITKYGMHVYQNRVIKDNFIRTNCAFVFPTPEVRDTFYENFKNLIEECKTLL